MPWSSARRGRDRAARRSPCWSRAIRSWSSRCMRCARFGPATRRARSSSPGSQVAAVAPSSLRMAATGRPESRPAMALSGTLQSLNVAHATPVTINGRKVMTAIGKRSVEGRLAVLPLGLEGDEQADLSVHGGPGKAVYAYPSEHYAFWQTVRAQAQVGLWNETLPFGAMGENLTLQGLREGDLWIGDVLRFPDCELA